MPTTVLLRDRRFVLHRVVADQDVRQRRRAAEEGQHQRQEIELVEQLGAAHAGERRAGAGDQQVVAARDLLVVDRGDRAVVLDDALRAPQLGSTRLAERVEEAGRAERAASTSPPIAALSDATWPTGRRSRWPSPLPCGTPSTSLAPPCVDGDALRLGQPGVAVARLLAPHLDAAGRADPAAACTACRPTAPAFGSTSMPGRARISAAGRAANGDSAAPPLTISPRRRIRIVSSEAEQHQQRALDELHPGRRHHARR